MRCPACQSLKTHVVDGRRRYWISGEEIYRRRYECRKCGHRFSTFEQYERGDAESAFRLAEIKQIVTSTG